MPTPRICPQRPGHYVIRHGGPSSVAIATIEHRACGMCAISICDTTRRFQTQCYLVEYERQDEEWNSALASIARALGLNVDDLTYES